MAGLCCTVYHQIHLDIDTRHNENHQQMDQDNRRARRKSIYDTHLNNWKVLFR